jgi:hypothetical protein
MRGESLREGGEHRVSVRGFIDGEYQDGELRGLTFLAGERGMGKTTEAIRLGEQCSGSVTFFDTVGKHFPLLRGFRVFSQPGPYKEYLLANRGRRIRVCYVPLDEFPEKHVIEVSKIARALGEWLGGMIVIIDEMDTFSGPEWGVKGMPIDLYNLAHFGRHYYVSMVVTARDPPSLSKRFRSQCAFMRLFRISEDDYAEYFAKRIGKANAAKLRGLAKTYFLLWEAGKQEAPVCGGPRKL